jgi:hypothetical protein
MSQMRLCHHVAEVMALAVTPAAARSLGQAAVASAAPGAQRSGTAVAHASPAAGAEVMKFKDEHAEQAALFSWAEFARSCYPELAMMFAIPNGGHRHKAVAVRMKAEGVKRGVPDICLPVPRRPWHGLYIELKTKAGGVSREQRRWLALLSRMGYRAEVCRGWKQAQAVIEDYLTTVAEAGRQQWTVPHPARGEVCHG